MELGILGPLTVDGDAVGADDGDGEPLAPRDRVVLATLAVTPREVVRPDRLADALWSGERPTTWPKVVQGCVVRIRKTVGAEAVRTTRQGYVLDIPDDAIDAFRFERAVRRGRELLGLHEPERARYAIVQALDLWHGTALADLEGWAPGEAVATRWEELRCDAEELAVEASLQCGAWREVLTEADRLVAAEPYREVRWALLARAQYQANRQGEALSTLQRARSVLADELGLDPGPELAMLERDILRQDPDLLPTPRGTGLLTACPYRGLLPYDVDDAEQYFGRDAEVARCREVLTRNKVVAVVGPSGSGKSSLVRAGIGASLRAEGRSLSVLTPGPHPVAAVAEAGGLRPRTVLVVDQLEEVVTLCDDPEERTAFLDAVTGHAAAGGEVVLAIRADRIGAISAHRPFARLLEQGLHLLGAMNDDDLRTAITEPARQAGLLLEPGLVDLLVQEVSGEPGALPLLSHALSQTWERREGRTMTVAGYRDSDGIQGAVAKTAERVFLGLDPREQTAARDLLLRLVVPVSAGEPARSPVPRRIVAPDRSLEDIIEVLVAARLVTSDGETVSLAHESLARAWPRLRDWLDADAEGQLTLRHLTRAADSWHTMGRPDSELYRGVRLARTSEWRKVTAPHLTDTETAFLDASEALARAESRTAERRLREQATTNRRLRVLLGGVASLLVVALVAGFLAIQRGRRADAQARLAAVRELAAASRAVLSDDPQLATLLALEASSPELSDGGPPAREAVEALHAAVISSRARLVAPGVGGSVGWSPTGNVFATEGPEDSGLVDIRDAATGESVASFRGHDIDVNEVAFGPDGALATAGDDGAVRVWDTADQRQVAQMIGDGQAWGPSFAMTDSLRFAAAWPEEGMVRVASLAAGAESPTITEIAVKGGPRDTSLSPDGSSVAIAPGVPGPVRVVDVRTGRTRQRPGELDDLVNTVAYSPDGRHLATASEDGTVRVFDAGTWRLRHALTDASSATIALAWSPDSTHLATGGNDGKARVYDLTGDNPRTAAVVGGASTDGGLVGLAFSPDGSRLLAGDWLVTAATVWEVGPNSDAEVLNVVSPPRGVAGVAFDPAGRLYTSDRDGSVAVWDGADGTELTRLEREQSGTTGRTPYGPVAVSADGSTAGAGQSEAGATVWEVASGKVLFTTEKGRWLWRPAFSPDAQRVAFAGDDDLRVYTRDGTLLRTLPSDDGFAFRDPAFSPDGRSVAAVRLPVDRDRPIDWTVVVWDWEADTTESWPTMGTGHRPSFSPDGARLALADVGLPPRVFDVESGTVAFELEGGAAGVADLDYSPDGSRIVTAGLDGTTILWNASDGTPLLRLPTLARQVTDVAFSSDGRHIATGSIAEEVVRVWTLDVDELRAIAVDRLVRGLTTAECAEYLHRAEC